MRWHPGNFKAASPVAASAAAVLSFSRSSLRNSALSGVISASEGEASLIAVLSEQLHKPLADRQWQTTMFQQLDRDVNSPSVEQSLHGCGLDYMWVG